MKLSRRDLASMAVFTALVAAATMVFSVYQPVTRGYFNVGEIMVYTTALLMGPVVGAFAGGVGSMVADVALGFSQFAPGTLAIKAAEGFIVGFLSRRNYVKEHPLGWKALTVAIALTVGSIVWAIGTSYLAGGLEVTLGALSLSYTFSAEAPSYLWAVLGSAVALIAAAGGFRAGPVIGWSIFSTLLGGIEMIFGYYLYEFFFLGIGPAAFAEVPTNMGQAIIGVIVAIPLYRSVVRLLPSLGEVAQAPKATS